MQSTREFARVLALVAAGLAAGGATLPPKSDDATAQEVKAVLAEVHLAAAEADAETFFGLLLPEAVFFGTAGGERYTVPQLRAWLEPYFATGIGWTSLPIEQNVTVSPDGSFATFDERLESARFGEMRATGALRRTEAGWRIAQFNTAFPMPNDWALRREKEVLLARERESEVKAVLDSFLDAKLRGDAERYFAHFAEDAVFMGTAADERFTVAELREFVAPYFTQRSERDDRVTSRNVSLSADNEMAWFDERVVSTRLGELRGTGVLRRGENRWRIVQYNLSFPVPNALALDLVERIKKTAP